MELPPNCTSTDFERAALAKLRSEGDISPSR